MAKSNLKSTGGNKNIGFPLPAGSYKMIMIGFGIVILGFILMMGGGSDSPDEFSYAIFSFRRITLAPIVVLAGFAFIFWAIMRKPKEKAENDNDVVNQ